MTEGGAALRVVATTSTSMGLTAAAIATTQLVFQFRPRLVAMIGIAAGTRSGGKQFGDVLVADPSVDYNSGKVVLAHGIREFQPDPYPIGLNPRLRDQGARISSPVDPLVHLITTLRACPRLFIDLANCWRRTNPSSVFYLIRDISLVPCAQPLRRTDKHHLLSLLLKRICASCRVRSHLSTSCSPSVKMYYYKT